METRLDISFDEFVARTPYASKRVANALLGAIDDNALPFTTIREYLIMRRADAGVAIPGFGPKLFEELDRLIARLDSSVAA